MDDEGQEARRTFGTVGGRLGHSALEAIEEAREAAEAGVVVGMMQFPMAGSALVKLIGVDVDGRCVYYTEVAEADAAKIREVLGATRESATARTLHDEGMPVTQALATAGILARQTAGDG